MQEPKVKPLNTKKIDALGNYEERNQAKNRFFFGLFTPGSLNTIIAEQGVGKSLLVAQIAAWTVNAGYSVVYIDADEASAAARIIAAGGPSSKDHPLFRIQNRPGNKEDWDDETRRELFNALSESPPNVLIIDTVESFFPDLDHNSAIEVKTVYAQLRKFTRKGTCVIVLDHTSKGSAGFRRSSQIATGSSQKASHVDASILLEPRQPPRDSDDTIIHLYVNKDRGQLFGNTKHATLVVHNVSPEEFRVEVTDWRWGAKPSSNSSTLSPDELQSQLRDNIIDIVRTNDPKGNGLLWTVDIRNRMKLGKMTQRQGARDSLVTDGTLEILRVGRKIMYRLATQP